MAKSKQHNADLLIVMVLFLIYAGCALMLSALGANSYNQTISVLQEGYSQRTGVMFISQRVHQSDIAGSIRLDEFEGSDALVLTEQETGDKYENWIFIKDGFLCEQLIQAGASVKIDQAQRITPMQKMELSIEGGNLLTLSLTSDTGTINSMRLALRSSGDTFNLGDTPPRSPAMHYPEEGTLVHGQTIMTPAPGAPTNESGEAQAGEGGAG